MSDGEREGAGTNPVDDVGMYGGRQLSTLSGITVHHVAAPPDIDRDREGDDATEGFREARSSPSPKPG